ncbi:hypothetical protein BN903_192 [Halorubrum sp. AJ67]|nr:hypothetical protein BN903_192 [Halorubrum sp. AJ67]
MSVDYLQTETESYSRAAEASQRFVSVSDFYSRNYPASVTKKCGSRRA